MIVGGTFVLRLAYRPLDGESILLVHSLSGDLPKDTAFEQVSKQKQ
jgi:hypothetical protein